MAFYKQNMTAFFTPKLKLSKGSIWIGGMGVSFTVISSTESKRIIGNRITFSYYIYPKTIFYTW